MAPERPFRKKVDVANFGFGHMSLLADLHVLHESTCKRALLKALWSLIIGSLKLTSICEGSECCFREYQVLRLLGTQAQMDVMLATFPSNGLKLHTPAVELLQHLEKSQRVTTRILKIPVFMSKLKGDW